MSLFSRSRTSDISTIKELSMWSEVHNMRHINTHTHNSRNTESLGLAVVLPISGMEAPDTSVITQEQNEQLRNELVEKTALSIMLCTHIPANDHCSLKSKQWVRTRTDSVGHSDQTFRHTSHCMQQCRPSGTEQQQATQQPNWQWHSSGCARSASEFEVQSSVSSFTVLSSTYSAFCYFRLCFFMSPKTWKLLHSKPYSFPLSFF